MKKIYSILIILFVFISLNAKAQDIYYKYNNTDSEGKRLWVTGSDLLGFYHDDSTHSGFNADLHAHYNQWKFNNINLMGAWGHVQENFSSTKNGSSTSFSRNELMVELFGGVSHYFTPRGFYGTAATYLSYAAESHDTGSTASGSVSTNQGPGYLYGALGYGRILNAGRVAIVADFAERLRASGILKGNMSQSTMLKLTALVDKLAYTEFDSKYWDDQNVMFFKQIESMLISEGSIEGPLDAANAVRLYETLYNVFGRYVNYPRYTGYQLQGQVQYQLFNATKNKPHDHYASINGVYGLPVSNNTSFVFSGYFALPIDTLASGLGPGSGFATSGATTFLSFIPDQNNLAFFNGGSYTAFGPFNFNNGSGLFAGNFVKGLNTQIGIRTDVFHSINTKAGVQAFAQFIDLMPKTGSSANVFELFARLDYNLTNYLRSYAYGDFSKYTQSTTTGTDGQTVATSTEGRYRFGVGLDLRIF